MSAMVHGSTPWAWSIRYSAFTPNSRYSVASLISHTPRRSYTAYFARRLATPGPMFQISVMGRWVWIVRSNSAWSRKPMQSSACFAVISSATFAKNRFGPTPAVARTPVSASTASMSMTANSRALVRYSDKYGVASMKHSSME